MDVVAFETSQLTPNKSQNRFLLEVQKYWSVQKRDSHLMGDFHNPKTNKIPLLKQT